jgi:hypothetical protein
MPHSEHSGLASGPACEYSTLGPLGTTKLNCPAGVSLVPSYGMQYDYPNLPGATSCSGYPNMSTAYGPSPCYPKYVRRQCGQ